MRYGQSRCWLRIRTTFRKSNGDVLSSSLRGLHIREQPIVRSISNTIDEAGAHLRSSPKTFQSRCTAARR